MNIMKIDYIIFNWYHISEGPNAGVKYSSYRTDEHSLDGTVIAIKEITKRKLYYRVIFEDGSYKDIHNVTEVRWITENTRNISL